MTLAPTTGLSWLFVTVTDNELILDELITGVVEVVVGVLDGTVTGVDVLPVEVVAGADVEPLELLVDFVVLPDEVVPPEEEEVVPPPDVPPEEPPEEAG